MQMMVIALQQWKLSSVKDRSQTDRVFGVSGGV